ALPMHCRDPVLELEYPRGSGVRIGDPGQAQRGCDVRAKLLPERMHVRRRIDVEIPVRHGEAALQQERGVAARVIEILRDPQAEQIVRMKLRVVQSVDVGAQRSSKLSRELVAVAD